MTTAVGSMPLAAFDLETTGVDPANDRIVSAHLARIVIDEHGTADMSGRNWILNPDMEIPVSASKVHGITTEYAREHGQDYSAGYAEIRSALDKAWADGFIVVVFNAPFDLTMMHAQGVRLGHAELAPGAVFDPLVIDKAMDQFRSGKRTLTTQCQHYGVKLDNAHEAKADAVAAARLAWKMLRGYDFTTATVEQIMECQTRWYAEQQENFARYLRKIARKITEPDEDGRSVDEQKADLLARADGITVEWPLRAERQGLAA